jgi:hypothetical protein
MVSKAKTKPKSDHGAYTPVDPGPEPEPPKSVTIRWWREEPKPEDQ